MPNHTFNPVAGTAVWIARARAAETVRPDALFQDPYAAHFAEAFGEDDFTNMDPMVRKSSNAYIAIRTRYIDDLLGRATQEGIRQIVLLAAGLDTRAFRLAWPTGTKVFEIDQHAMFDFKEPILRELQATPDCERILVPADLRHDWIPSLLATGFDLSQRTIFILEGLVMYLPPDTVAALLRSLHDLAAPGSQLYFDVPNHAMMHSRPTAPFIQKNGRARQPLAFLHQ